MLFVIYSGPSAWMAGNVDRIPAASVIIHELHDNSPVVNGSLWRSVVLRGVSLAPREAQVRHGESSN
jgi:hypothetical protein